eukprot:2362284-Lingulodinium_polyedra.AAC.1
MISSLEGHWDIAGAPRCPHTAVDGATVVALISGRHCGPAPFRQRATELALAVSDFAAAETQDGYGRAAARDGAL